MAGSLETRTEEAEGFRRLPELVASYFTAAFLHTANGSSWEIESMARGFLAAVIVRNAIDAMNTFGPNFLHKHIRFGLLDPLESLLPAILAYDWQMHVANIPEHDLNLNDLKTIGATFVGSAIFQLIRNKGDQLAASLIEQTLKT